MLRTGSPDKMIDFYTEGLNMEMKRKKEMDTFTLYFLGHPDQTAEIELTYNHGEEDRYKKEKDLDT
jgi:catechol 2,3-dioxygenase-like lactoylglutathione lyase family enzyme